MKPIHLVSYARDCDCLESGQRLIETAAKCRQFASVDL